MLVASLSTPALNPPPPAAHPPPAETLHAVQHSEPARFAGLVGGLDANVQRAVQGMMQYAAELKEEQAKEAAAAAAAAAAAPPAAETVTRF